MLLYRLQLFRSATAVCSCTPRNLNRNHVWEKRFRWHNPSLGRRDRDGGSKQQAWTKQSLPQRYLCVGCQLKSDQALRSLCLIGHVRARGSTLWRHRWQEASEFLCTKTPLFGESWATKISPKTPENAFSDALLMSCFPWSRLTLPIDWCCFYYFLRNSLVALLEALFARKNKSALRAVFWRSRNVASDESGSVCFKHTQQKCCGNVMNSSSARSVIQRLPWAQTRIVSPAVPYSPLGSRVCATPPVCVCVCERVCVCVC